MMDINTIALIAKSLTNNCQGKDNAINRDVLIEKLAGAKNPIHLDHVTLSEVIQTIRKEKLCEGALIENKGSYYISKDENEIQQYIQYLDLRANELLQMRDAIIEMTKQKSSAE